MQKSESMLRESGITLNCFEVLFNKHKLTLHKADYSQELYEEYKANPHFFIYRYFDKLHNSSLFIWKLSDTKQAIPKVFREAEITLDKHAWIFTKIVESAIVQLFRDNNREIFLNKYSYIWNVELKSLQTKSFGALLLRPTMAFSLGSLYSMHLDRAVIVLNVRKRMKRVFIEDDTTKDHLSKISGLDRYDDGVLIPSTKNQYRYLESIGQKQNFENYRRNHETPRNEYEFFMKQAENFKEVKSQFYLPNGLKILDFSPIKLPNDYFKAERFPIPQYFYHNERPKVGSPHSAISKLQPYSFDKFDNVELNILVVCYNKHQESISKFLKILESKLSTLFHLNSIKFDVRTVKSPETHLDVLDNIDAKNYNLAIIVITKQDRRISPRESLYHLTKAKLLNQRLLSQELTIEKIKENNEFINRDIALNVYSKLGGIAWTVERASNDIPDLIVGIGSTVDQNGERIIGFVSIFDYNGTYIVGDCSQMSTMDEYAKNLEVYLVETLTNALEKKGLSENDEVRLIFHLFKEAGKKHELTAIENALNSLNLSNIRYSLVHLSKYHNFLIFKKQGKDKPNRGTIVQLTSNQALLHLGGRSFVPILVRVDKRSKYNDIYEITQQVLHFAHLSYRSFIQGSKPVTMKYPTLMAKMVTELKEVPNWDYSILNNLNDDLWFI